MKLLDFDGTLFHTAEALSAVYKEAFENNNILFSKEIEDKIMSGNFSLKEVNIPTYIKENIAFYKRISYYEHFNKIIPNKALLNAMSENDIIVSNTDVGTIFDVFHYFGIKPTKKAYGKDNLKEHKPGDAYGEVIRKNPAHLYEIYEDSATGLKSAELALKNNHSIIIHRVKYCTLSGYWRQDIHDARFKNNQEEVLK